MIYRDRAPRLTMGDTRVSLLNAAGLNPCDCIGRGSALRPPGTHDVAGLRRRERGATSSVVPRARRRRRSPTHRREPLSWDSRYGANFSSRLWHQASRTPFSLPFRRCRIGDRRPSRVSALLAPLLRGLLPLDDPTSETPRPASIQLSVFTSSESRFLDQVGCPASRSMRPRICRKRVDVKWLAASCRTKYRACRMRRPPVLNSRCWRLVRDQFWMARGPASWRAGVEGDRVWMTCTCGAVLVRVVAFG